MIFFVTLLKCKPPTIEDLHFGTRRPLITKTGIITTLYNALEDIDQLTFDYIYDYLLEEYSEAEIEKNKIFIKEEIKKINEGQTNQSQDY